MPKKIRVGIIRCDTHAVYYAALFARHDPLKLRQPRPPTGSGAGGTWVKGGAHFYHYTYYGDATRMTAPFVGGFKLARLWDANRERAEIMSDVFLDKPIVVDRFEEASDDVDMVYIADCNGEGSDHLKLATPGLKKRVPTFIDKPLAYDVKDALSIAALAKRRRVPMLSLSIMRCVPEAAMFKRRLAEVGTLGFGFVKGGGTKLSGQVHAISMAQHIFGAGVESVEATSADDVGFMQLHYGGRSDKPSHGVMLGCDTGPTWHCAMFASAYGSEGAIHTGPIGDFVFPKGAAIILQLAKKMVRTGQSAVPYEEMIENIAVVTAARRAKKLGRTVRLNEVWRKSRSR